MARETLTYDASNGFLTGTTLGSVSDSFGYSEFGELEQYSADFLGSVQFSTHFTRDKLGRIEQKSETVNGVNSVFDYDYDVAGRLIGVQKDSVVQNTYTYDANGNRQNNGAVYDDQDRLTSNNTATYSYTANGELLTKVDASGTTTYTYDVLGNLMSVQLPSGDLMEYVVDGRNRRLAKLVNGTPERAWLYKDSLNPVAELDGAGNVVSRFVYGAKGNVPDFMIRGGITYRIISDHLGSPRMVIDTATGAVVQELDYDEWGVVTTDTNPNFQPFAFAGGLYDTDTKLVRFGARDYDPEIGRWTSKDPILFEAGDTNLYGNVDSVGKPPEIETNLYGYTMQDPVNFIDLNGERSIRAGLINIFNRYGTRVEKAIKRGYIATKSAGRKARKFWDDLNFDGPERKFKQSGVGRICQLRFKNNPVFRLDYAPYPGTNNVPYTHYHILPNIKDHKPIPRFLGGKGK